jgi:hypothetical protein
MCAQRGVVTFVTPSPLLPSLLNHAKPRGDCVTERKHSNRVPEDILPSLAFGDPLLLGREAGMELLNRPVTGDKWHLRHFVTVTALCLPTRGP